MKKNTGCAYNVLPLLIVYIDYWFVSVIYIYSLQAAHAPESARLAFQNCATQLLIFLHLLLWGLVASSMWTRGHVFDAADAKRCSFSPLWLIKTNPALTPCCLLTPLLRPLPCWITLNLLLMTDCGGWVRWACKQHQRRRKKGGHLSNILFLNSFTRSSLHPLPPPPSPPHRWTCPCQTSRDETCL